MGLPLRSGWQAAPIRLCRSLVLHTGVQETAWDLGRMDSSIKRLREVVPLSLLGFNYPQPEKCWGWQKGLALHV